MIHCQNCTTRNPVDREFCAKCGARLLVLSKAAPLDSALQFMDEHYLERISAVEHGIARLNERMDAMADAVDRLAAGTFIDHAMIEALTDALKEAGIDLGQLEEEWRKRIDSRMLENERVDRLGLRARQIVASFQGADRQRFEQWIEKAYTLIVADQVTEGTKFLEAAFSEDPANTDLAMLLAEIFFQRKEPKRATRYLTEVLKRKPSHFEATLLRGLVEQRTGDVILARQMLERAAALNPDSAAAHAALGSLLMSTGNRKEALLHLKRAHTLRPSAVVHFMLSSLYSRNGRRTLARRHLKRAAEMDPHLDEKTGPDRLNGLIREELRLSAWGSKRPK